MSLGLNGSNQSNVDAGYRTLRVIWLSILVTVITLFIVTRLVESSTGNDNRVLFWILMTLGLIAVGASFVVKQKLLRQAFAKRSPELTRSAYMVALAMCEAAGIFGLIAYFVTGTQYYYLFFVLSGFGILLHKPQRDDLLAASNEGKI
jgi:hypothetical protein